MSPREILVDTFAHMPPRQLLDGLTDDDAERKCAPLPHSIAEVVAHLEFWQAWFLKRCQGEAAPMAASAAAGWPGAGPGGWPALRARFLDGLEHAAALGGENGRRDALVTPAIEFPPLARMTVGDVVVHLATHNAHHLGQVVLLRQLVGCWPPPAGSYTW
jgi:uncharacterized damage-inducible protein DinB